MPLETSEIVTLEESRRLVDLEEIIEKGIKSFIAVGEALAEIRDKRLYRLTHGTFEDYCKEEWQMSKSQAHRLCAGVEVVSNLVPNGTVPQTEPQTRPLRKLPPEQQPEAWTRAVGKANGEQPTAKQVAEAVEEVKAEVEPPKRERTFQPSNGMQYATLAIENLKKIQPNDTERDKAFMAVQRFLTQNYQAK